VEQEDEYELWEDIFNTLIAGTLNAKLQFSDQDYSISQTEIKG
jgi:hypothetical protein